MKKLDIQISCLIIVALLTGPFSAWGEYDIIDIDNPSLQKIPIAIPFFNAMPPNQGNLQLSRDASDMCAQDLTFTGYFKILDRGAFLDSPQEFDIAGSNINFRNWTAVGAELLITGGLTLKDNLLEMELRLFDTVKGQLVVGKRYKGWKEDQQRMIRRFCNEVILYLTGSQGLFSSNIAFVSNGSGNKEIHICDFDGQKPRKFTTNKSIPLFPAWSSDGKWLAYTSYKRGRPDIFIRHISENRGVVISKKGINITPAWVPGEFKLAATLSYQGDQEIYLLTGKGEMIKKLTNNWGIDTSPTWSPDGKKMAFVSNRSGTPQIHIRHMGSGRVERLTFQGKYNTQPSWSPRGDKVAYSARNKGAFEICVIGFDGSGPAQLTHGAGNNESPSWSPDGSMIAFSSTREGPSRIYIMTAYGTDQRRLLALSGQQTNPQWSPGGMNN